MDGLITTGVYADVEIVKKKSEIPDPVGSTVPYEVMKLCTGSLEGIDAFIY